MLRSRAPQALLALGGLALAACGEGRVAPAPREVSVATPTEIASGDATVGGDVVATVEGVPITLADVEALSREEQLAPREALRRIENDLLLSRAAERAGLGSDPEITDEMRRAAVRALLRRVIEPAHLPEAVTEAELEARRAEISSALSAPETRRAAHLLIRLASDAPPARVDAAMRLARRIRDELSAEADPATALDHYGAQEGSFDLTVEHLDPMAREHLAAPFAEALFAATPGLLPEPVRTSYGVHAIVLVEVVPPWEVPREDWEPPLRRQLAAEARAAATEALVDELSARTSVTINAQLGPLLDQVAFDDGVRSGLPGSAGVR